MSAVYTGLKDDDVNCHFFETVASIKVIFQATVCFVGKGFCIYHYNLSAFVPVLQAVITVNHNNKDSYKSESY